MYEDIGPGGSLALEQIIANMPGHVYWKDRDGVYLGYNDTYARRIGFEKGSDIVGKTDYELPWPEFSADVFRANDKKVMETGLPLATQEVALIDCKEAVMLSQKIPLRDRSGEIIGILGISTDITELKQSEIIKSRLLHGIQNDISTPCGAIQQTLQALAAQEQDAERRQVLEDTATSAGQLVNYCHRILDFSKVELGFSPLLSQHFNMRDLCDHSMAFEQVVARQRGIELLLDYDDAIPKILIGDRHRLQSIIINLLSNGIKFTEKGHVKLKALLQRKLQDQRKIILQLVVEDTGTSMSEANQVLIYRQFSRHGIDQQKGIGLYIVRQFVTDLDADIKVKSSDQGTAITMHIPLIVPWSES